MNYERRRGGFGGGLRVARRGFITPEVERNRELKAVCQTSEPRYDHLKRPNAPDKDTRSMGEVQREGFAVV
jgi:hypothetical protein